MSNDEDYRFFLAHDRVSEDGTVDKWRDSLTEGLGEAYPDHTIAVVAGRDDCRTRARAARGGGCAATPMWQWSAGRPAAEPAFSNRPRRWAHAAHAAGQAGGAARRRRQGAAPHGAPVAHGRPGRRHARAARDAAPAAARCSRCFLLHTCNGPSGCSGHELEHQPPLRAAPTRDTAGGYPAIGLPGRGHTASCLCVVHWGTLPRP